MCMVDIRNRKTLQSKVNVYKSDVKFGDYADSLCLMQHHFAMYHNSVDLYTFAVVFAQLVLNTHPDVTSFVDAAHVTNYNCS